MDFFSRHKTLYGFVSLLLAVSLVVYCFGFYSVQAAEISSLPSDIDITVTYDADNINWTYDGTDYSFSRDFPLVLSHGESQLFYNATNYRYLYDYKGSASALPLTVEADSSFVLCRASYWFSPSENALYIIRDDDRFSSSYYSAVRSYGVSNGRGSFYIIGGSKSVDFCVLRYDFNDRTFIYGVDEYLYGNHSFNAFKYYDFNSGIALKDSSNHDTYMSVDDAELTCYIPFDLLCIFSNYEISGFYEPDTSKVNTPDYYFNYQYIFYRDGKGYTFVDSAQPLVEVTAQGSYAYLTFSDSCNKYIYTSVDGITWDIKTTVDTMYGGTFTKLAYDWLYDKTTVGSVNQYDAELVYTNDDKFGDKPLVTPSFGDLTDITDKLNSIVNDKPLSGRLLGVLANDISLSNFFDLLAYGIVGDGFDFWIHEDDPTDHGHFGPRGSADVSASYIVTYPSLATYLYNLVSSSQNLDITLSALREDSHNALKSVFDNVTVTNAYLSTITDKLGKFPDYTAALRDISAKLDKLDLLSPDSPGGSVLVPFDDTAILGRFDVANGYLKDIKGLETGNLLTNILNLLTGTDGEGMKVTINPNFKLDLDNNLKASFSAKIDKLFDEIFKINASLDKIAEFNLGSGGGTDKDYSSMLTLINDNLYTASGRIYDANQSLDQILQAINSLDLSVEFPASPSGNDLFYDDPDSDEDLIDFVSEYAKTALDKSYFASFLTFDNDTMTAIRFYNGLSEDMFKALGPLGAALLVSVGFTLVGAAVRKT